MGKKTKPPADATVLAPDVPTSPGATVPENTGPASPPDATILEPDSAAPPGATVLDSSAPVAPPDATVLETETATLAGATLPADADKVRSAEDRVASEWEVGDVILDLYEVKHIHTSGAMGVVYRVSHRGWNMDLAVKSPRPDFFATEAQKANFVRECETWIGLGLHPHTVSCHYVRRLGVMPRVFAEYVEGGSLSDWIKSGKLYEGGPEKALERILDVAIQFAWGLGYAHEQDLIHQDIKPANLMLTPEGVAKVTDFGLAQARPVDDVELADSAGGTVLIKGRGMTPAYCSPEQAAGAELSRKTDIWSWAVSLLEMFTGEVTWVGGQLAAEALASYTDMDGAREDLPDMPPQFAQLLRRCFETDPAKRPGGMKGVASRLQEIYHEVTGAAYPRTEPKTSDLLADALNNQAVSLLDLGRQEEAEERFARALQADSHHPEATCNRGLLLWRSGRITDDVLVRELEEVRTTHEGEWRDEYHLGLVHMERGDAESAIKVLEEASAMAPDQAEIQRALTTARGAQGKWRSCLRTFTGYASSVSGVNSICFSADGRLALSGSSDKALGLWDLETGKCVRALEGHTELVESVSFSPDGCWALSGSWDKTLRLWELATGKCVRTLEGHAQEVSSVSFSPDGRWALSGSYDKTLRLWELATGKCVRTLEGHTGLVESVSHSPDGLWALSGGVDHTMRLWELAKGQCVRTFEGHKGVVNSVSFSPDGRWALSGSDDKTLRLWELAAGRCVRTFVGHTDGVSSISLSPDGRWVLSGSPDRSLRLWELATGRCVRTLEGHAEKVSSVSFSPNGHLALSGSSDRTLRLWEVKDTGPEMAFAVALPRTAVEVTRLSITVSEAKQKAMSALERGLVSDAAAEVTGARRLPGYERDAALLELWREVGRRGRCRNLAGAWFRRTLEGHSSTVGAVTISADGRWALSGSDDHTLHLWDLATGQCAQIFEGHTKAVSSVSLSPDGRWALSGSGDHTLRLWELATGKCLRVFEGHTETVTTVNLSPDGHWALSGSQDHSLRLWELATGRCVRTFEGYTGMVSSVAFSQDRRWVLSGGEDKTLRLWDLATGHCVRTLEGHTRPVKSVSLSPDGRWALSGSGDNTMRLWEPATARCVRTFGGHSDVVNSVSFSPDGRWALSGSDDKTLRLWELATGRCVRTFEGHKETVHSVCLSPDGHWALSGSSDRTLSLWELDWDYEFPESVDWDDGAHPYLETFLAQHTPDASSSKNELTPALIRRGKPAWSENDFQHLRYILGCAGYGWLRPDGVQKKLEELAANGQGPHEHPGKTVLEKPATTPVPDAIVLEPNVAEPKSGESLADGLNNRAVSLLDLGRKQEAEGLFNQALQADPHHLEATYNRGVALWRSSRLTDDRLVQQLEAVCGSHGARWTGELLLALVHLERGDPDTATTLLEEAIKKAPAEVELQTALELARSANPGPVHRLRTSPGHSKILSSACFSPDDRLALSSSEDHSLRLWELASGHCIRVFEGSSENSLELDYDAMRGFPPLEQVGHTTAVLASCFTPDGQHAWSGSADSTLKLWKVDTGKCIATLEHPDWVTDVCASPDGRFVLTGCHDHHVRMWDRNSGDCWLFKGHSGRVTSVSVSSDSRWALSGSVDGTLRLWELEGGRCHQILKGHDGSVNAVCILSNGWSALSGGDDKTLRLWDLASGRCQRRFNGHVDAVRSISVAHDTQYVLSSGGDARLWEIPTGRCLRTFGRDDARIRVHSAILADNGRWALLAHGKTLQLWQLPEYFPAVCQPQLSRLWTAAESATVEGRPGATVLEPDVTVPPGATVPEITAPVEPLDATVLEETADLYGTPSFLARWLHKLKGGHGHED